MIAARRSALAFTVHSVDDGGALCGARPRGSWRLSKRVPINCPSCLAAMRRTRYALGEVPTAGSRRILHLRVVGPRGLRLSGGVDTRGLCGALIGWDVSMADPDDLPSETCRSCRAVLRAER